VAILIGGGVVVKSFTGCCPLEDHSSVCTPSHHCRSLAPYAAFFYSSCSGAAVQTYSRTRWTRYFLSNQI
jgi:hypothetical protein